MLCPRTMSLCLSMFQRNIPPRTREVRRAEMDKEALEKYRLKTVSASRCPCAFSPSACFPLVRSNAWPGNACVKLHRIAICRTRGLIMIRLISPSCVWTSRNTAHGGISQVRRPRPVPDRPGATLGRISEWCVQGSCLPLGICCFVALLLCCFVALLVC